MGFCALIKLWSSRVSYIISYIANSQIYIVKNIFGHIALPYSRMQQSKLNNCRGAAVCITQKKKKKKKNSANIMDRFLTGLAHKRKAEDEASPNMRTNPLPSKPKSRKHDEAHLALGFTCTMVSNEERPQCVVCLKVLACDSLKPNKLRRHLETKHPEHKDKSVDLFRQKLLNCRGQQCLFTKAASVSANALLSSYKVAYRVAQCKKPHTIAEELILPCAMDLVSTMTDDTAASKLRAIPLSNNTIERRIYDMSKDIEEQLNDKVRDSSFSLQMDEDTDSNKDCLLITYVRCIDGDETREELLSCKQVPARATAEELFKITDSYLKEADLKWEDCVGICTDGAQAMAGERGGLQALIKRVSPNVQWTHCMIHREALASKQLSDVITDVIGTFNYIKTRPVKAWIFLAHSRFVSQRVPMAVTWQGIQPIRDYKAPPCMCVKDTSLPGALNTFDARFGTQNNEQAWKTTPSTDNQVLSTARVRRTLA
uniref:Uncharacterized protein n=1 Tax=Oreochromis niloticus TaxID=8128 RepID=A0A669DER0_ORENI